MFDKLVSIHGCHRSAMGIEIPRPCGPRTLGMLSNETQQSRFSRHTDRYITDKAISMAQTAAWLVVFAFSVALNPFLAYSGGELGKRDAVAALPLGKTKGTKQKTSPSTPRQKANASPVLNPHPNPAVMTPFPFSPSTCGGSCAGRKPAPHPQGCSHRRGRTGRAGWQ